MCNRTLYIQTVFDYAFQIPNFNASLVTSKCLNSRNSKSPTSISKQLVFTNMVTQCNEYILL